MERTYQGANSLVKRAMDLLQQGAQQIAISLWLDHESIETIQVYLDADLERKAEDPQ